MRNLLVGMFMLLTALSANAVNLAFKFDVTSSGNSMYACDAGLVHTNPAGRVCYDRRTLNSCNPKVACTTGDNCDCVCTGGGLGDRYNNDQGEYRLDFMTASYGNWTDNGVKVGHVTTKKYTAGASSFKRLFADNSKFGKQLTALSFDLGSERYGAEYFVDVCFRATQIEYPSSFDNGDRLNWSILGGVTVTDLGKNASSTPFNFNTTSNNDYEKNSTYQTLSGLKVRAILYCKNKNGHRVAPVDTGYRSFSNAQLIKLIDTNTNQDLKGCYFRYYFKESKTAGIPSVRKWKKQKARICTYSSVNEPLEE
jgi:hypothetical protein